MVLALVTMAHSAIFFIFHINLMLPSIISQNTVKVPKNIFFLLHSGTKERETHFSFFVFSLSRLDKQ